MADHVRKQIRDTLTTALTGLPTVNTIYSGFSPLPDAILPSLVLKTNDENSARSAKAGRLERILTVEVEGYAQASAGILDILDGIAVDVETALGMTAELSALVKSIDLIGTQVEVSGQPIKPVGLIRLIYEIVYHTFEAAPDAPR